MTPDMSGRGAQAAAVRPAPGAGAHGNIAAMPEPVVLRFASTLLAPRDRGGPSHG